MESIHTVGDHDGSGMYTPPARIIGRSPSYLHRSFGFVMVGDFMFFF
jgi:hypothetical protein